MLTYLLAKDPRTSAGTLAALIRNENTSGATLAAALTHPNLDTDAPLADDYTDEMDAAQAHQVLTNPATNADRRARLLTTLGRYTWRDLLNSYADLTEPEIAHFAAPLAYPLERGALTASALASNATADLTLALAVNASTPRDVAVTCLRTLAYGGKVHPMSLLILAEHRAFDAQALAELASLLPDYADRSRIATYLDGSAQDHTLFARAVGAGATVLRRVVYETRSIDLMAEAMREPTAWDMLDTLAPHDHPHPAQRHKLEALRALLAHRMPAPAAVNDVALAGAAGSGLGHRVALRGALLDVDVTRQTLETVISLTRETRDVDELSDVHHRVGAHPNCPPDVLANLGGPGDEPLYHKAERRAAYHLACARAAGRAHPGLDVPLRVQRDLEPAPVPTTIERWIQDGLRSRASWPLNAERTTTLLALEETFTGTIGELLDATDAVSG